jgi:hypothetical protein
MNKLVRFLNELWIYGNSIDLSGMSVTMIPNILQLTGTILTLLTALLSSLGLFEATRKKLGNFVLVSKIEEHSFEEDNMLEIMKASINLKRNIRELI